MRHPHSSHSAVTLSVKIPPEIRNQLENLADATGRAKSLLATEAIENYLAAYVWQIRAIKKAVKKADSKKANFISHDRVAAWLNSWGTKKEQDPPE